MTEKIRFTPDIIDKYCLIDVRTPLEYQEDHIPGALNVPLLDNAERIEIGTIYKHTGAVEARRRALQLTCGRFHEIVTDIANLAAGSPIAVYCWRGGLRSQSVTTLLALSAVPAVQLVGGYKAYRGQVNDFFDKCDFKSPLIVIHGMTGTGKTSFINGLNRDKWGTVDLEGVACHRGSAFGALGLKQDFSQKYFETLLWDAFRRLPEGKPIVLEGESKRIGRYSLPGNLYGKMAESSRVWCQATLATRIERLVAEYARPDYSIAMLDALERIKKKLDGNRFAEMKVMIERWEVEDLARCLITDYYDRMYYKKRSWQADLELDLEDYSKAESELEGFYIKLKKPFRMETN